MGPRDDRVPQQERPASGRRSRLWLGYSEESLSTFGKDETVEGRTSQAVKGETVTLAGRDGNDDVRRYSNLDALATSLPVDEEAQRSEPHLEDKSDKAGKEIEGIPKAPSVSRAATELYTISYLIVFSIAGTLARLGLQALTFYPGAPVQTGLLWANVGGSLFLGFLSEGRMLFHGQQSLQRSRLSSRSHKGGLARTSSNIQKHTAVQKTIPLYIGLATGFCGSFTSFSAFMRDAFFALSNALPVPVNHPSTTDPPSPISTTVNVRRNGGYSFMALLAVLITTLGLSMGALQIGAHLALVLEPWSPSVRFILGGRIIDRVFVFLALGFWLGAVIMAAVPPDRPGGPLDKGSQAWRGKALFALVFAPLGCMLRYYVSLLANSRIEAFPLGTFVVNISGTALQAMLLDLQHAPVGSLVGCQVLQGLEDGFCGCLTTVSTWVAEIKGLRRRHAYRYAGVSLTVGLAFFIVITGSQMWTQGFKSPVCIT